MKAAIETAFTYFAIALCATFLPLFIVVLTAALTRSPLP